VGVLGDSSCTTGKALSSQEWIARTPSKIMGLPETCGSL
jgi:hypothetical protein